MILACDGAKKFFAIGIAVSLALFYLGCGQAVEGNGDDEASYYLSGSVATGMGQFDEGELVLRNVENEDMVTIDWGGESLDFEFSEPLKDGEEYRIVVYAEPPNWDCGSLENTQGTIDGDDVDDIVIECYSLQTAQIELDRNNTRI